jgi:hypothetical protein
VPHHAGGSQVSSAEANVPTYDDDVDAAAAFLGFLRGVVWASPDASPGLDGSPTGRVLTSVDLPLR